MKKLKKFVSYVMLTVICSGVLFPATVYAAEDVNNIKYPTDGIVEQGAVLGTQNDPASYFASIANDISTVDSTVFNNSFDWSNFEKDFDAFNVASGNVGSIQSTPGNLAQRMVYSYIMDTSIYARYMTVKTDLEDSVTDDTDGCWSTLASAYDGLLSSSNLASSGASDYVNGFLSLLGSRTYAQSVSDKVDKAFSSPSSSLYNFARIYGALPSQSSSAYDIALKNRAVLLSSIYDYAYYATEWRESVVGKTLTTDDRSTLAALKLAHDAMQLYIPILDDLWNLKDPNKADDKSLKELCEDNDVQGAELSFSTAEDYEHIYNEEDVIGHMYQLNGAVGISGANMKVL